ncbi:Sister chromatid cohesion protein 2 [Podila humilis]|nr:Sister chromatid cohesion protein 2 [Podila humilis]
MADKEDIHVSSHKPTAANNVNVAVAPTNAQTGLQYSALASLTPTDSMLRDLASLKVAFPEFRLLQPQDPMVQAMLSQKGLGQHAANFERQYLMTLVANANMDNIRFPSLAQISVNGETMTTPPDPSLTHLPRSILQQRSYLGSSTPLSTEFQLPTVNPYDTLIEFKQSACTQLQTRMDKGSDQTTSVDIQDITRKPPAQTVVPSPAALKSSPTFTSDPIPPMSSSQKRNASANTDDELDQRQRAPKKAKSRRSPNVTAATVSKKVSSPPPASSRSTTPGTGVLVGALPPVSKDTPSSSVPDIPSSATRPQQSSQDLDPVSQFEDAVTELLEAFADRDVGGDDSSLQLFLLSDVKRTAQSVTDLAKKELMNSVQVDTMALLLKHLDKATNHFDSALTFPLDGLDASVASEQEKLDTLHRLFDMTGLSLSYVSLNLVILGSQGLQQHLFLEELVLNTLNVVKSFVEKFLAPALEHSKDDSSTVMGHSTFKLISCTPALKQRVVSLVGSTCEISALLRKSCLNELSEGIVVKLVYIALSLFFIDSSSEMIVGQTEAESLKQAGSSLLRLLYSRYQNQRMWILEEILSSLVKLPHGKKVSRGYRLRDGSKIHASSALLLQLVHTCAENPAIEPSPQIFQELDRLIQREAMLKLLDCSKTAMDKSKSSVGYICNFLLSRSAKATKSSVDADYKAVLESWLHDLLIVLGLPEWPSAELCLLMLSKAMMKVLDDSKAELPSRQLAVELLGLIAAKIKTISNALSVEIAETKKSDPRLDIQPFYGQVKLSTKKSDLSYLQARYGGIMEFLAANEINDIALKAANSTWIWQWGGIIWGAVTKADVDVAAWGNSEWDLFISETIKCWSSLTSRDPPVKSKVSISRKDVLFSSSFLTSRLQLFHSFDMLLSRILQTLECSLVVLRAKSLKALSLIVTGDYEVLAQQNVRKTISLRLQDSSPAVRDVAIDLVGKYMLQDTKILRAYYEIVSDRISDTGLNVRKRVIRLLKDIYAQADSTSVHHDISRKLLLRVNDDETTVRELAIKSVNDIWFSQFVQATKSTQNSREDQAEEATTLVATVTPSQKRDVLKRARKLVDMVGQLSASQGEAFGSVIQSLMNKEQDRGIFDLLSPGMEFTRGCSVIVGSLVELVEVLQEENAPKTAVISTVHTLYTFIKAEPRLAEAKHLSALEAYLHNCTTNDDWKVTMFVLRIYECSLPVVQRVSGNFSQSVEKLVSTLLSSCPIVLLPEAVHVLCLVVLLLTRQSARLCKLVQSCTQMLKADLDKLQTGASIQEKKTVRLMMLCGLLVRHFPFEQQILESPEVAHLAELKSRMDPTVQDVAFKALSVFCEEKFPTILRLTGTKCLGYLFMSFPTLMDSDRSKEIMTAIFDGSDTQLKAELIHVYNNFLVKLQTAPAGSSEKSSGYSLVAKAEDHIDAGIGSAIMQQYLERIRECALEKDANLQLSAMDVIGQVTNQALGHPGLCMPQIVALETSPDEVLSERAIRIHKDLHQKHPSLIYAKSMECVWTTYLYQKRLRWGKRIPTEGFRWMPEVMKAVALLGHMYNLLSDKRQIRNAFLANLVKLLDVDLTIQEVEVDGDYSRFIAENLACLEYKTMEEILLVIFYLNRIIAGTGMTLMENISASSSQGSVNNLKKKAKKPNKMKAVSTNSNDFDVSGEDTLDEEPMLPSRVIAKASIPVETVIVLKTYLKRIYDISEGKCQQFQPTASASHKEKPTARWTGGLSKIQWRWEMGDVARLCGAPGQASEQLVQKQLARFKYLMDLESIQKSKDGEDTTSTIESRLGKSSYSNTSSSIKPSGRHYYMTGFTAENGEDGEESSSSEDDDDDDEGYRYG